MDKDRLYHAFEFVHLTCEAFRFAVAPHASWFLQWWDVCGATNRRIWSASCMPPKLSVCQDFRLRRAMAQRNIPNGHARTWSHHITQCRLHDRSVVFCDCTGFTDALRTTLWATQMYTVASKFTFCSSNCWPTVDSCSDAFPNHETGCCWYCCCLQGTGIGYFTPCIGNKCYISGAESSAAAAITQWEPRSSITMFSTNTKQLERT